MTWSVHVIIVSFHARGFDTDIHPWYDLDHVLRAMDNGDLKKNCLKKDQLQPEIYRYARWLLMGQLPKLITDKGLFSHVNSYFTANTHMTIIESQ